VGRFGFYSDAVDIDQYPYPGSMLHGRMENAQEHQLGTDAPTAGRYRLLNVFGTPTHLTARVRRGEAFPHAPRAHSWRLEQETGEDE
jgi:hypothetical protein